MNYIFLISAIVALILVAICYIKRDSISKWIKKNKNKAITVISSIIMMSSGAGIILIDDGGFDPPGDDITHMWTDLENNRLQTGIYWQQPDPIAFDVDGDGYMEIFVSGHNVNKTFNRNESAVKMIDGVETNSPSIGWYYNISFDGEKEMLDSHVPCSIGDLNNDGTYEIVISCESHTLALNAENGTVFWESDVRSGWHHTAIVDVDGNGLPYVYVGDHGDVDYRGISKLYGTDGTLVTEFLPFGHCCYGGVTAADLDNDGDFEILYSNRNTGYGNGVSCFDSDLNSLWNGTDAYCASHPVMVYDIDGDGDLEVIAGDQNSGDDADDIYVYDHNGNKLDAYSNSNADLSIHVRVNLYDIDKDGNPEFVSADDSSLKVYDVVDKTVDFTYDPDGAADVNGGTIFADVVGDSDLEMIVWVSDLGQFQVFNSTFDIVDSESANGAIGFVLDIDNDGYNEIVNLDADGYLEAWDTVGTAASPDARGDTCYYSERRIGVSEYIVRAIMNKTTIRNTNDGTQGDYFTWMGPSLSASDLRNDYIDGFDEENEWIAIWAADTWDINNGSWVKYYGDEDGTDFTVDTLDVVAVFLDDSGTQTIEMILNVSIDYDAFINKSLSKTDANKGFNYLGYTNDDVSTLSDIVDKSNLTNGESILWWNRTSYGWEAWIVGFTPATMNHDISKNDVFIAKVVKSRYIHIGEE